jgi:hypothetical protein
LLENIFRNYIIHKDTGAHNKRRRLFLSLSLSSSSLLFGENVQKNEKKIAGGNSSKFQIEFALVIIIIIILCMYIYLPEKKKNKKCFSEYFCFSLT